MQLPAATSVHPYPSRVGSCAGDAGDGNLVLCSAAMCLQDTCETRQGKGGKEELFLGLLFCEFSASEKCWIDSSGDGSAPHTAGKGQPSTAPSRVPQLGWDAEPGPHLSGEQNHGECPLREPELGCWWDLIWDRSFLRGRWGYLCVVWLWGPAWLTLWRPTPQPLGDQASLQQEDF